MVCGLIPAVFAGGECYHGNECDEGLDCFYYGEGQLCLAKDVPLSGACSVMDQCADGNECRNLICEAPLAPLVAVGGDCTETSECVEDLTCFDMTCMDIPAAMYDDDCKTNSDCANMLGLHTLGECRNSVCSTLPAVAENNHCDYGYECDEGLECDNG